MSTNGSEKLLLKMPEVAEILSVSRSHAYKLVAEGRLPVIHLGRAIRVPKPWVEKFVAEQVAAWERARAEE